MAFLIKGYLLFRNINKGGEVFEYKEKEIFYWRVARTFNDNDNCNESDYPGLYRFY